MPGSTLDLSDINLPATDAEKPAETTNEGADQPTLPRDPLAPAKQDDKPDVTPNKPEETKPEDKDAGKPGEETKDGKSDEKPNAVATDATDQGTKNESADGDKKDEKLTPFHEHPDWIKAQETIKDLQSKIADLSKPAEVTVEKKEEARLSAEERLRKDIADGWEPKDQVEITARGLKYMQEDMEADAAARAQKARDEGQSIIDEQKNLITNAGTAYQELGITDIEVRRTIGDYIYKKEQEGVYVPNSKNIAAIIKESVNAMKADGKLDLSAKPAEGDTTTETDTTKKTEKTEDQKKEEDQKKQTNQRIARASGDTGDATKKTKKSYAEMHNNDLDNIVFNVGKTI